MSNNTPARRLAASIAGLFGPIFALPLLLVPYRWARAFGWKREPDWGDVTFMTEHDQEITKIAVVGEEQWRDLVFAFLAKGFRQAEVEYFLPVDLAKARAWLGTDSL